MPEFALSSGNASFSISYTLNALNTGINPEDIALDIQLNKILSKDVEDVAVNYEAKKLNLDEIIQSLVTYLTEGKITYYSGFRSISTFRSYFQQQLNQNIDELLPSLQQEIKELNHLRRLFDLIEAQQILSVVKNLFDHKFFDSSSTRKKI